MSFIKNNKGVFHLGVIIFILALIGLWFIIKSFQEGKLEDNMKLVLEDYKNFAETVAKDEKTKKAVKDIFKKIENAKDNNEISYYLNQLQKILKNTDNN